MAGGEPPRSAQGGEPALANRQRIFEFVKRTPGAHLREIQRALSLPYGTAEYHLHALEDAQVVRSSHDGNLKRYYAAEFAFADRAAVGLLRKRPVRRVVMALLERGELTHQELAAAAGIQPPTLSYHLPRLEAAKLVETKRDGRFTRIKLVDPKAAERLLIAHGASLGDRAVDRFMETWSGFRAPGADEEPPERDDSSKQR